MCYSAYNLTFHLKTVTVYMTHFVFSIEKAQVNYLFIFVLSAESSIDMICHRNGVYLPLFMAFNSFWSGTLVSE